MVNIALPLDNDGFLRRECPSCEREFKRHDGPANAEAEEQPSPVTHYCPFCGSPAGPEKWFTQAQVTYIHEASAPEILQLAHGELTAALRKASSKHFRFKPGNGPRIPEPPEPLMEPDDMTIVTSPCHGWEPVKVPDRAEVSYFCVICGEPFAV